jgi:hypothetical protein
MLINNLYPIEVYDGLVPQKSYQLIWDYLAKQTWHMKWQAISEIPAHLYRYKPTEGRDGWLKTEPRFSNSATYHRTCLSSDEPGLKKKHPLIWGLWKTINNGLGNEYEITGNPEYMLDQEYTAPQTEDATLLQGWRVYVNGAFGQEANGTWGPHRDTVNLDDETSVTIVYVVNPIWYPRFAGEIIFFPEDPDGLTGDHQQFNKAKDRGGQLRGFNVGWPDQGKTVSPCPGRVIVFDGRALHNTRSISAGVHQDPCWKIVFRARRKTPWPN